MVRDRIELSTFRFSGGRSYRLSYLTVARCRACAPTAAVLTGFEPATSTLTGWRALRLLYRTMLPRLLFLARKSISPTLLWLPRRRTLSSREEPRAPTGPGTEGNRLRRKNSTTGGLVVESNFWPPGRSGKPGAPNGIRTRAAALKGRCPRPLDDRGFGGYRRNRISPPSELTQHRVQPTGRQSIPALTHRTVPARPGPCSAPLLRRYRLPTVRGPRTARI